MPALTPTSAAIAGERVGTNKLTGKLLYDFDHCVQSIWDILRRGSNTRIMLLDYGSDVPAPIDQPGNRETFALFYSSIAQALINWEPGFRITQFQLVAAGQDGQFIVQFAGLYYPRGHLGDYSVSEDATHALSHGLEPERHPLHIRAGLMTTRFSTIDLTQLAAPQVIDALDYNTVIQARPDLVTQLWTAFQA